MSPKRRIKMKGLIIDTPHIDNILSGGKTWEMRSRPVSIRGDIALIRKGSKTVVGVAKLVDVLPALTENEMLAAKKKHQIDDTTLANPKTAKWRTPWVLENAQKLKSPVPYDHPNGAVTWVNLDDDVAKEIKRQSGK
jgi:hypothetical protein